MSSLSFHGMIVCFCATLDRKLLAGAPSSSVVYATAADQRANTLGRSKGNAQLVRSVNEQQKSRVVENSDTEFLLFVYDMEGRES